MTIKLSPTLVKRMKKLCRDIEELADCSEPDRETIEGETCSILYTILNQTKK